jgi:3-hydroxy-5-methyl-1-naphthoate 3-O-methyltransferase
MSQILSISVGAWETKVLSECIDIGLFTKISEGHDSVDKISQETGIDVNVLGMLVKACGTMGLIDATRPKLVLKKPAGDLLVKGKEGYLGDFIMMLGGEYYDVWRSFKDVVMTGKPVRDDRMARMSNPRHGELHLRAMAGLTAGHASEVADRIRLAGKKSLLEIGGGIGTYSSMIAGKNPGISVTVFDSPFACDAARRAISSTGAKNVDTKAGDYFMEPIPKGSDAIMLSYVLHNHPPMKCESLLGKIYDALPAGGVIIVNEFRTGKNAPGFCALMELNAFMMSDGGSLYNPDKISEWLSNVGFHEVKLLKTSSEFLVSVSAVK